MQGDGRERRVSPNARKALMQPLAVPPWLECHVEQQRYSGHVNAVDAFQARARGFLDGYRRRALVVSREVGGKEDTRRLNRGTIDVRLHGPAPRPAERDRDRVKRTAIAA